MARDARHGDQQARSNRATREAVAALIAAHPGEYERLLAERKAANGVTPQPRPTSGLSPVERLVARHAGRVEST